MTKKNTLKLIAQAIIIAGVIYVGVQFINITDNTVQTQTAVAATMTESIICNGIISREETVVTYSGSGLIGYNVADGQRVSAGESVANEFDSYEQMVQSANSQLIQMEIDALNKSNITSAGTDANMILNNIYINLYNFLNESAQLSFDTLSDEKLNLQLASNKSQIVTQKIQGYSETVSILEQKRTSLGAASGQSVTAPVAGFFVSAHQSSAKVYTTQQLAEMTPAEFNAAASVPAPQNNANVAGKILHDYKWSMFISVTLQQSEKFKLGDSVDIVFPKVESEGIPAFVENITLDEQAGVAKIELACNYINSAVVTMEHTQVEVVIREHTGLRINKEAVHVINGVQGVYVQTGTRIDFCVIDIIFENENYVLVKDDYVRDENELKMFDSVVLEGRELYDGRVV